MKCTAPWYELNISAPDSMVSACCYYAGDKAPWRDEPTSLGAYWNAPTMQSLRRLQTQLRTKDATATHGCSPCCFYENSGPGRAYYDFSVPPPAGLSDAQRANWGEGSDTTSVFATPEFIALGSVIHDMLHPDFILIGESDPRACDLLASIHIAICASKPPIQRMNFINAEIAKIAVNSFVTIKTSFANMISDICDRMPGDADATAVTKAIGSDSQPEFPK